MLSDEARNRAFAAAIEARVQPGARVLDIGAGCGPWAILAAKRGASRVVAIERNPAIVPVLRALVRDNGLTDKIEIVVGDSQKVAIDGQFDVIVSETIGSEAFDENIVAILRDARARWLAPGGVLVPERLSLVAAPARLSYDGAAPTLGIGLPLHFDRLRSLFQHFPAPMPPNYRTDLLAAPATLIEVDLSTIDRDADLSQLTATWHVDDASLVEGISMWVAAELAPGVTVLSRDCPSWTRLFFPFDALPAESGSLAWDLDNRPQSLMWRARFGDVEHLSSPHLVRAWWQAQAKRG